MGVFKDWSVPKYAAHEAKLHATNAALPIAECATKATALEMAALRATNKGQLEHQGQKRSDNQLKCRVLSGVRAGFKDDKKTPFLAATCSHMVLLLGVAFLKITAAHSGHKQRFGVLREFVAKLWGGKFQETMQQRLLALARVCPNKVVQLQTEKPRGLNDHGVDAMCDAQCRDPDWKTKPSAASEAGWHLDAWRIASPLKFLQEMFKAFGVHKIVQGAFPYMLQIAIDGAPMTNRFGLVTLILCFCDPRTCDEIRQRPQSRKFAMPFAGAWGSESFETLLNAFKSTIDAFQDLAAQGGVWVEGVLVPFFIVFGLDKKLVGLVRWDPMLHVMPSIVGKADAVRHVDARSRRGPVSLGNDDDDADGTQLIDPQGWSKPWTKGRLEEALHAVCRVPVAAFGAEDVDELVAEWSKDAQTLEAKWRAVGFRTSLVPCVAVMGRELAEALTLIDSPRRAEAYMQFRGPGEGSLWGNDQEVVAEDGLHLLLRAGRMVQKAFMARLRSGGPQCERDTKIAERLIQLCVPSFKVRYEPDTNNTEIAKHEDGDKNVRAILALFASEEQDEAAVGAPTGTGQAARRNPPTVLFPDVAERRRWWKMFYEYNEGIKIVRMVPTIIPGEEGCVEQLHADADKMQGHLGAWWVAARPLVGVTVLTNYGHSLKGGNFSRFMKRFGYLIYFSADAMEQKNDDNYALVHCHSQKFGSCGRNAGARKATMVEALWGSAVRQMAYMTGKHKEILAAHAAAVRAQALLKILHLLRVRIQYRRGVGEAGKQRTKRQKRTDSRVLALTRHGNGEVFAVS
ncbi:hypothetical protein M885DRAFT_590440 [Pelagophyceae sp. CCMP2097]|nr:hypothetical protein M885DRAFT_590440 [Pelagophyceae sp. CCMP2097]